MKIILKPIRAGKTTELIKLSAEKQFSIICFNRQEALRVASNAKYHGFKIPFPMTYDELINKYYYGKGIKGILVDNADMFIDYIAGELYVEAITITAQARLP